MWSSYAPDRVQVGGEIRHRMDITADKILHHMDIDRIFARHYRNRQEKNPDLLHGFAGYGMLLDAVVKAAVHGIGGTEMRTFKTERLAELARTQSGDGAVTVTAGPPALWDNHDQAYLLQAYSLDFLHFGCRESLETAIRLGDYLIRTGSKVTLGSETAFLMLYRASGERRFLDCCLGRFRLEAPFEEFDKVIPVNTSLHVYTALARTLAQLQYARMAGKAMPETARQVYARIFGPYSSISGTCSGPKDIGTVWNEADPTDYLRQVGGAGEVWNPTQHGLGKWGETCASAYLLRCTAEMLRWNGDPRFGDLFERVMYNAFFGAQSGDGMLQRYYSPFNEPGEWWDRETYCCPNNLRRMMFELPDAVYFRTPQGTAVNLYTDSSLNADGMKITQQTGYPESGQVKIDVENDEAMELKLRIPGWCPQAQIRLDGKTVKAAGGQFFPLQLEPGKHAVELDFPLEPELIAGFAEQAGRGAVMRGPLVYALPKDQFQGDLSELDDWMIDNSLSLEASSDGIRIPFSAPEETRPTFTRFSDDRRLRTYFAVRCPERLKPDPLYKPQ